MVSQNGFSGKRRVTGVALFKVGTVVGTPGAAEVMDRHGLHPLIIVSMHASGIWGDIPEEDRLANEEALESGARLMSVYKFGDDTIWVITEADRKYTTVLTPDEY